MAVRGAANRLEREQKARLALAWHVEAFARTKRLPKLAKVLGPAKPEARPRQTAEQIQSVLRGLGRPPREPSPNPVAEAPRKTARRGGVIARTPTLPKPPR